MALFLLHFHPHIGRLEPTFADLFNFHVNRQLQGIEGLLNGDGIDAGIDQSAECHVAADAAETVKMGHFHRQAPGGSLILPQFSTRGAARGSRARSKRAVPPLTPCAAQWLALRPRLDLSGSQHYNAFGEATSDSTKRSRNGVGLEAGTAVEKCGNSSTSRST